jgi:hypothetical protein
LVISLGESLCHRLEEKSIRLVLRICGRCSHGVVAVLARGNPRWSASTQRGGYN